MQRTVLAITVCAALGMSASTAFAAGQQAPAEPTQSQIQQKAMQDGPSTGRIGYTTRKDPVAPHRDPGPVDPKLMRPLTQREAGMLYNACIAYPECKTAYARAYEHNQALLKAQKQKQKQKSGGDSGH